VEIKHAASAQLTPLNRPFAFLGQAIGPLPVFSLFYEEPASLDVFLHRHAELSGERGFLDREPFFFVRIRSRSLRESTVLAKAVAAT
jgi:hypothetical protein